MPRSFKDFARPTYRENRWLETQWFAFWTESGMRLHFWAGFRTPMNVATSKVFAVSTIADSIVDMDYCDQQYHLPMADARLSDFRLQSGIAVKGHPAPDAWTLTYTSPDRRLVVDAEITSMMAPVDLGWTKIDGAGPGFVGFHQEFSSDALETRTGLEPSGHIDQTVRVVGTVTIDGEVQQVDGVGQHDHSWSPRAEYHHSPGNFDIFEFGDELTLLAQTRPVADGQVRVTHGYVLRNGETRKLTEASVSYERAGFRTKRVTYTATDESGERYEIIGNQETSFEIDMGPNIYISFDQYAAEWSGRVGRGESQWHEEIMRLQKIRRLQRTQSS